MTRPPLWVPDERRVAETRLAAFMRDCDAANYSELHRRSITDPDWFWSKAWGFCGLVGDPGDTVVETGATLPATRFFPNGRLNVVDTLLARDDEAPALLFEGEDGHRRILTWNELGRLASRYEQVLGERDVQPGERVAAMMANTPDLCAIMLAAASIGAVFTSVSPDFGAGAVVDRLGQVEPVVLFAHDRYFYAGREHEVLHKTSAVAAQLEGLRATIAVPYDGEANAVALPSGVLDAMVELARHRPRSLRRTPLPFDHPWYILYSSGTTGRPKCIVHRAGGVLLKHLVEHQLHCDVRPGDRVFYFTTAGWMMWNWLVSALGSKATAVLYDGSPMHPRPSRLFDLISRTDTTLMGVSARFLDGCRKAGISPRAGGDLGALRTICSTGSPLAPESFAYVYDEVKADVHLASISGGTDLCGCLVAGDPTSPVYAGEIQRPALGLAIEILDETGAALGAGNRGELTCATAFPSMPLGFWADPDGVRYQRAYFERFPGRWHQGDYAEWTDNGGVVIHGRSDATLNPGGVRIGTAEIYRQVESLPEIAESLVIGQERDGDTRIVLFVRLAEGATLDDDLRTTIRERVRNGASPRHVPAVIVAVADLPRTRSGKLTELAVRDVVHRRPVVNAEALANPEALELFVDLPELR